MSLLNQLMLKWNFLKYTRTSRSYFIYNRQVFWDLLLFGLVVTNNIKQNRVMGAENNLLTDIACPSTICCYQVIIPSSYIYNTTRFFYIVLWKVIWEFLCASIVISQVNLNFLLVYKLS